jgi:hypothetical protein
MLSVRAPILHHATILDLRPTQISVGMREVEDKRHRWREKDESKEKEFLQNHVVPVVTGPKGRHYIIDHHHLVRALHEEGVKTVYVTTVVDLSRVEKDAFWVVLDTRGLMHPFDDNGRRRPYEDLPKSITGLIDDPFRSLAGELRRHGGFAKDTTPFNEFLWADFLRRRIKRKQVENDFDEALKVALKLATTDAAEYLPGWSGRLSDEVA